MRQRVDGYKNVTKGLHLDFGDKKMGFMVEHLLIKKYGAMKAEHFSNDPVRSSPGKKHFANASKEIQEQAKNYAEYIKFKFDTMSHGDGIKKMSVRGCP
ncbi:hypothetical protein [Lysinibacillus sp. JNUCC 51]|uniref:hypothetical protein n=1 Tax=Lysinibacillus sp. JNUCC-51 TaxID=2792479 RepID=UPI0019355DFA|nr:hypothetical protein JNUCC51_20490 [Lysinibacillus sp. JNUCC-51]